MYYGAPPPLAGGQLTGPAFGSFAGRGYGFAGGARGGSCVESSCRGCGSASCGGCGCSNDIMGYTYGVVPEGTGEYVATTAYRYVGLGAGNVALFPVPAVGPGCSCWWSMCLLWLLCPLLWFLFESTTTTTTTPPIITTTAPPDLPPSTTPTPPIITTTAPPDLPPITPIGICRIYGDPHVRTFDGSHASFYSAGEYWMVKSNTVWIQGRYAPTPITNGLSVVKEVAVGGPFLQSSDGKNNILRITALKATWNGKEIIPSFPDQWSTADPSVEVVTDSSGEIMQEGREGKKLHVVHVKLPDFVALQINRWNEPGEGEYLNVKITMPVQPGQDGHCGNFNGNPLDDTRPLIRARIGTTGVDPANLLFEHKTPVVAPNRPDLNNCPTEKANHAQEVCKSQSSNGMASSDCMIDVCFGGDKFAALTDYN